MKKDEQLIHDSGIIFSQKRPIKIQHDYVKFKLIYDDSALIFSQKRPIKIQHDNVKFKLIYNK